MRYCVRTFSLFAAACFLGLVFTGDARAWGPEGHSYAVALAIQDMQPGPLRDFYQQNSVWLQTNASFSDRWKLRGDRLEPSRHFFYLTHYIPASGGISAISPDPQVALHGMTEDQLRSDGILPWVIDRHTRLLSTALRDGRWDDAMVETAWLSGYAADACLPFRASDEAGDASTPGTPAHRFEVGLVRRAVTFRELTSGLQTPPDVRDPAHAALDALRGAYAAAPGILAADKLAGGDEAANGPQTDLYWSRFTFVARPAAVARLQSAGRLLAGLLMAAWSDAGRPALPAEFVMTDSAMVPFAPPLATSNAINLMSMPIISVADQDTARNRVQVIAVASKLLNRNVNVSISLPLDYADGSRHYPVLYLLHGSSGSENDWPKKSGIAVYSQDMPLIVVMPDAGDSWYVDSTGQGAYESFFIHELVPAIDARLRTIPRREGRALAGNSMGGYGAWRLALDHNEMFCCSSSISGALDMGVTDPTDGEPREWITGLYGGIDKKSQKSYYTNDLYRRIDNLTKRGRWTGPALHFSAGWDDYLLEGDRHMVRYLLDRRLPYEYAEFPGSHDWPFWDEHVRDVLCFTLRHVSAPLSR